MQFAPDGRLFVCEQGGRLRVVKNGTLLSTPFLTLPVNTEGERGLLGVAFDPEFGTNPYVYAYYTAPSPAPHNRVSRFTANGDVAVPGSETVVLELPNLVASIHNGGAIHFGPDGMLYIATGENGDPPNAQSLNTLLGKILRIRPDGAIPTDNPFSNTASGVNRAIWALGLRNPFTFAFDPATGRMFINDVGQHAWEEIDEGVAGSNYGWPVTEGPTSDPRFRGPLYAYPQPPGGSSAIAGGAFYSPETTPFPPLYRGRYFFADYPNGWIKVFNPADRSVLPFATGVSGPVDLKVGPEGSLYSLSHEEGIVYRITYSAADASTLTSVELDAESVKGGRSVRGRVRFSRAARSNTRVTLFSSNPAVAAVPRSGVLVRKGFATGRFTVRTRRPRRSTPVTIRAGYAGETQEAALAVRR
jgi:glucose/arabinose dehydrogenase